MDGARRKSWSRSKNGHEQHRMFECLPLLRRCNGGYYGCSDSIWGLLCEELIVEILCLLPQKALIKFKCVSKHWYYLISEVCVPRISPLPLSGIFRLVRIMKHLSVSGAYLQMPNDTPLERDLFTDDLWFHLPRPLRNAFTPSPSELLDMCNGLCLYFSPPINLYCIWNFTTHQFVLFPPPPPPLGFEHNQQEELNQCLSSGVFSALAFDPKQSLHFKVVRFDHSRSTINPGVRPLHIFSSETREWVEFTVDIGPPPVDTAPLVNHCVYLNQALYRLSTSLHLLRYDLEKKVNVTVLKLPDSGSWTSENTVDDLGCIGSSLGCRLYYARHCATRVLIWMLCDCNDASDWVLMHCIRAPDLINHELSIECTPRAYKKNFRQYLETCGSLKLSRFVGKFLRQLQPVAFDPTSDAVILWAPEVTLWYHLGNNKLEVICNSNTCLPFANMAPLKVLTYSRCLIPLKDLGWNHYRQDTGHRPYNFHDVPLQ